MLRRESTGNAGAAFVPLAKGMGLSEDTMRMKSFPSTQTPHPAAAYARSSGMKIPISKTASSFEKGDFMTTSRQITAIVICTIIFSFFGSGAYAERIRLKAAATFYVSPAGSDDA